VLSGLVQKVTYLKHGLAAILLVVGVKMLLGWAWAAPAWVTLGLVAVVLGVAVAASWVEARRRLEERKEHHAVRS
jgi:tellurite resistance protein TerC